MNITKPIIFWYFMHLTSFVITILVKSYCFASLFVPILRPNQCLQGWPPEIVSIADGPYSQNIFQWSYRCDSWDYKYPPYVNKKLNWIELCYRCYHVHIQGVIQFNSYWYNRGLTNCVTWYYAMIYASIGCQIIKGTLVHFNIQCVAVVTQSIFSLILTIDTP